MTSGLQKRRALDNKRVRRRVKEIKSKASDERTDDERQYLNQHQ